MSVQNLYWEDMKKLKTSTRSRFKREREKAKLTLRLFNQIQIAWATRDCVFAVRDKGKGTRPELIFSFRGTAIASDLFVDAQLAANVESIGRLDDARAFVAMSIRRYMADNERKRTSQWARKMPRPISSPAVGDGKMAYGRMWFFGHSLGGFIAEGAGIDYRQAQIVTLATGAPLFETPNGCPAAYNKRQSLFQPTRIVREADLVPMGVSNMGQGKLIKRNAIKVKRSRKNSLDIFHRWLKADPAEERSFLSEVSNKAALAVSSLVQKAREALAQHSLTNDATWHSVTPVNRDPTVEEKALQARVAEKMRRDLYAPPGYAFDAHAPSQEAGSQLLGVMFPRRFQRAQEESNDESRRRISPSTNEENN